MAKKNYWKKSKVKKPRKKYSVAERRAYWVGYGEGSHHGAEFNHNPDYENPKLVNSAKRGFEKGKYDFYNREDPTKNYDVFGIFGSSLKVKKR